MARRGGAEGRAWPEGVARWLPGGAARRCRAQPGPHALSFMDTELLGKLAAGSLLVPRLAYKASSSLPRPSGLAGEPQRRTRYERSFSIPRGGLVRAQSWQPLLSTVRSRTVHKYSPLARAVLTPVAVESRARDGRPPRQLRASRRPASWWGAAAVAASSARRAPCQVMLSERGGHLRSVCTVQSALKVVQRRRTTKSTQLGESRTPWLFFH